MQPSYMKIPPPPSTGDYIIDPNSDLSSEEDYSYYYTFLQDAITSLPLEMPTDDHSSDKKKKRGRGSGHDGSGESHETAAKRKRNAAAAATVSLALLEEQEGAEQLEWDRESQQDLAFFETNYEHKARATDDYYFRLHDSQEGLEEESDGLRAKSAHLATATVAAAASTMSDGGEKASGRGGGGTGRGGSAQHHHRRLWVKDRSRAWWDRCNSPDFPEAEFRRAFRMGRATFDMICDELGSAVAKEDTMLRAAIPVRQRVAVCIWRLATGEPLRLVSKRFGLGISTCHKLVLEVCTAIQSVLMPKFVRWPSSAAASAAEIKARFESASGIPDVMGSMYTTHIPIIAPKISVASYFNKRHTERNQKTSYSVTVQGVVDPDGVFTDVCIGWPGSMPDDQILESSALYQRAQTGLLQGEWIVGGSSYPLMDWVLVPYSHQNLTWTQHAFNEKIGEVQRVAREAFARLKGRWKCLQRRTEVKLQDLPGMLGACCVLHNICEASKEEMDPELRYELVDDEMVPENGLRSASSMQARDTIAHNLLHHGLAGTAFF